LSHGGNEDSQLAEIPQLLDAKALEAHLTFSGKAIRAPFETFSFFASDDMPDADWHHPIRYAFVNAPQSSFAILFCDEPIALTVSGEELSFEHLGEAVAAASVAPGKKRKSAALRTGAASFTGAAFPAASGGDSSRCHALLVSGGYNIANNHCRYWNEVCFVYNVLRRRFQLPKNNIKVLWAGGNPARDLCRNGTCTNTGQGAPCGIFPFETSNLSDFDLDGENDIAGAATLANVRAAVADFAARLGENDQLLIFFSDHGGTYGGGTGERATVCLWGEELKDGELDRITRDLRCSVMFALKTCYSGGMISEIVDNSKYRAVATADRYDPSRASLMMGDWTYYFFSALCGYYPEGTPTSYYEGIDPRSRGGACDADADGDGRVSFYEAHQFAYRMNRFSDDVPQYAESTANLGKKLFMTKYADVPVVAVRDKVLAPVLSPSTTSLGYAPQTIRASCATPGATIRYTADGSAPTATSAVYGDGIVINGDATVSVRAFKSGMDASDVVSVAYTVAKVAPQKATIVSVSQGDSVCGIAVRWVKGDGAETYSVLRGESSAMASQTTVVRDLPRSTTEYFDTTAMPGKTYYYKVVAANKYGSTASVVSQAARRKLSPPKEISCAVTAGAVTSKVRLQWAAPPGASYFRVYRVTEDGARVEVSNGWQSGVSIEDSVAMNGAYYKKVRYCLQSAVSSGGTWPSDLGEPFVADIDASVADKAISFSRPSGRPGSLSYEIQRTMSAIFEAVSIQNGLSSFYDAVAAPLQIQLAPGENRKILCEIVDGVYSHAAYGTTITYSTSDPFSSSIVSGSANISLSKENSGYDLTITAKTSTSTAPAVVRTVVSSSTAKKSRDILVYVSSGKIVKKLDLADLPRTLVAGEKVELSCLCNYMDGSSGQLPAGTEVEWAIVSGKDAEIDDGELVVHQTDAASTITLSASVETAYGTVVATKGITIVPALPKKEVAIPALGGASSPEFVVRLPSATEFRFPTDGWLSGISILYSDVNDVSTAVTFNVGASGRKTLALANQYIWLSFSAERNSGKNREQAFSFRWDGGGMNFVVRQAAAPVANAPRVTVGASGSVSASAQTDGSVLRYATDGEEPSGTSPVFTGTLVFDDDTECAFKAFGDWMQSSGAVYADVVGRNARRDMVSIGFAPAMAGLAPPASRTYRIDEVFGTLPSFPRTNGLFFKGWSLVEGSETPVAESDAVPSADATLFAIWSETSEQKSSWVALPWNFEHSITVTAMVFDEQSDRFLSTDECTVVVEDDAGVCRGSTENGFGDTRSVNNGDKDLHVFGVYGSVTPERYLNIRVWVKGKGFQHVQNLDAKFPIWSWGSGVLGSAENPFFITLCPARYTIILRANDGGGGMECAYANRGESMALPSCPFKRDNHTFAGWATSPDGAVVYADGASVRDLAEEGGYADLYAKWMVDGGKNGDDTPPPPYTIAFNANGGKLPKGKKMAAQKMTYGKAAKLRKNLFTKKGYVFAGWALSKAKAKKGVVAYGNAQKVSNLRADGGRTTLYAVWAKPTYKVAFYANGGKGRMSVQTFTYGKAKKLLSNKFKAPKGKKFAGWAKSKAAAKKGKAIYRNKQKVKNLLITGKTVKLYAVWKKKYQYDEN
jgi:hypothetical protein